MEKYKMRAEGINDVFEFMKLAGRSISNYTIYGNNTIPDVEFEFESSAPFLKLMTTLHKVPDGHVMCDTLQPISTYTGER